jgi:hypothetical protein
MRCKVCNKKTKLYETKVRGRIMMLCKEHHKEYYGC